MRDIFSEGLLYLDLLEIYGSTYAVSEICGIAQSNVFRGANACSKLLNLGLSKDKVNGIYRAEFNLDVQRDLRKLNQKMRARENGFLRVGGADRLLSGQELNLEQSRMIRPLPIRWSDADQSIDYLERYLFDVLIVRASEVVELLPWPPSVRRTDLFVPFGPLAATELQTLPLILVGASTHRLLSGATVSEACDLEWLVDENISLFKIRSAFPATKLHPIEEHGLTIDNALARVADDQGFLLLTELGSYKTLSQHNLGRTLRPLELNLGINDHLLMITVLSLIQEPVHQSLMRFLRELAGKSA